METLPEDLFYEPEIRSLFDALENALGVTFLLVSPRGETIACSSGFSEHAGENLPELSQSVLVEGRIAARLVVRGGTEEMTPAVDHAANALERHAARCVSFHRQRERSQLFGELLDIERRTLREMAASVGLPECLEHLLDGCLEIGGVESGAIYVLAPDASILEVIVHRGLSQDFVNEVRSVPMNSVRGRFTLQGRAFFGNLDEYPLIDSNPLPEREGLRSLAIIPILFRGNTVASINLASHQEYDWSEDQRERLEILAAQAGAFISRLRAESARQRAQRSFESLFNAVDDFVFMLEDRGRILHCNPTVARRLGYSLRELTGMHLTDLLPDENGAVFDELLARHREGKSDSRPVSLVTRTSTHIPADLRLLDTEWNDARAVCAIVRDMTAHRVALAQLRLSEERYRGMVESQLALIVRVTPAGQFTFANDAYCEMFGISREDLYNKSFQPLVHKDDLPATLEAMKQLEIPPYRCTVEQRAMTVHGWRWFFWEDVAIKNEEGQMIEIQAVGRDITVRKQTRDRLIKGITTAREARELLEQARETLDRALGEEMPPIDKGWPPDLDQ